MDNDHLYQKISSLPDKSKSEVEAYVDAIILKCKEKNPINKAKAGSGKGMFVMLPGFDEPMDDFKEYIQ